jgi:cell fate regulator YaaT (PSP1 superfamily)
LNEKNARDLEEEKLRYKSLQEEHENERNYLLKTIENNLEAHKKELKEINDDYQLKLSKYFIPYLTRECLQAARQIGRSI